MELTSEWSRLATPNTIQWHTREVEVEHLKEICELGVELRTRVLRKWGWEDRMLAPRASLSSRSYMHV
jgi:hypothetical protein